MLFHVPRPKNREFDSKAKCEKRKKKRKKKKKLRFVFRYFLDANVSVYCAARCCLFFTISKNGTHITCTIIAYPCAVHLTIFYSFHSFLFLFSLVVLYYMEKCFPFWSLYITRSLFYSSVDSSAFNHFVFFSFIFISSFNAMRFIVCCYFTEMNAIY